MSRLYGFVLEPDRRLGRALTALAAAVGAGSDPVVLLGREALPHLTIVHFHADQEQAAAAASVLRSHRPRDLDVRTLGLTYGVVPAGDFYVPQGGFYFGIEVLRRPDLDRLHQEFLATLSGMGIETQGSVGPEYRPHMTLGVTAKPPLLPTLSKVPIGEFRMSLAFGPTLPHGNFRELQ
jgi:2'-5' RNA ligase